MKEFIDIPDTETDRYATFGFISWWDQKKVRDATIMVVGAGALGNEVLKNLALMGIGHVFVIDFDTIEAANLTRSVLFRMEDNGKKKAFVATERVKEINPDVKVQAFHGDVNYEVGLGVFRRMDVVIGVVDSREARLSINRFCYRLGKPWIDGAIGVLNGQVSVFILGKGACYECMLTEQDRKLMNIRYSCPLLARTDILLGKVPTSPTVSSIIAGIQTQEMLKLLHKKPVHAGKTLFFGGANNDVFISEYPVREDCESHRSYGEIIELKDKKSKETTLREMLKIAREHLGDKAILKFDRDIITELICYPCDNKTSVFKPQGTVSMEEGKCPACGEDRAVSMTHTITGQEEFLDTPLLEFGMPPLHIIAGQNSTTGEYRYFELTGDLEETLHFT